MISRRTTKYLGILFRELFKSPKEKKLHRENIYDFLYENEFEGEFCNIVKKIWASRSLQEWLMKLHTGESIEELKPTLNLEERKSLGQKYLEDLAEDVIQLIEKDHSLKEEYSNEFTEFIRNLELDGYSYCMEKLIFSEAGILDVEEEAGILQRLYTSLNLNNLETAKHHLELSEEHYADNKWSDSISNSRKFFECVLREVASKHSQVIKSIPLLESVYSRPVKIRDYLETEGLINIKEKTAISAVYGLLSETGGHPHIANNEQARLLRHLALTFSQYIMLSLEFQLNPI